MSLETFVQIIAALIVFGLMTLGNWGLEWVIENTSGDFQSGLLVGWFTFGCMVFIANRLE